MGYDSSIYDLILKSKTDNRPFDDMTGRDIREKNYIFYPYLIYPDIAKPSTTANNNNKNQDFYCKLNYINKNDYI